MRLVNQKTGEIMSATDVMQKKRYNKQKVEKKKMREGERETGREREKVENKAELWKIFILILLTIGESTVKNTKEISIIKL